ncbi:1-acyl-sn-glycerol-3-phosphate acyltransferase [Planctomycetota bacterium]|nr:1-acyl-sn-glycerol-3-phosphate acyltransferase [Planctomycetota bacterium]
MKEWKYETARDHGEVGVKRMESVRREMGLIGAVTCRIWSMFIRTYLRSMHRLEVHGKNNIPKQGPFVLVANHTSHLDALILGSLASETMRDRVFSIAAGDVFFKDGVRGTASALLINALPMKRGKMGRHAMTDLRTRLVEDKVGYVIFPEGTRARDGHLGDFKAGIGMLVCDTDVPVIPCWIEGAWKAWPSNKKIPNRGKISISIGQPKTAQDLSNDMKGWKECAAQLKDAVLQTQNQNTPQSNQVLAKNH